MSHSKYLSLNYACRVQERSLQNSSRLCYSSNYNSDNSTCSIGYNSSNHASNLCNNNNKRITLPSSAVPLRDSRKKEKDKQLAQ